MADKDSKIVRSPLCRISYPNVFKPQKFKDSDKETYNVVMLIPKTKGAKHWRKDPVLKSMVRALKTSAIEKWGELPKQIKLPFKDGDKKLSDDEADEAYAGMWVVAATSDRQPGIVAANAQDYLTTESDFYAGCYAFVSMNAFAWKNDFNKCGCSFGLRNIQKVKDGPRLGGVVAAHDDFDPIDAEDTGVDDDEFGGDDDDDDIPF